MILDNYNIKCTDIFNAQYYYYYTYDITVTILHAITITAIYYIKAYQSCKKNRIHQVLPSNVSIVRRQSVRDLACVTGSHVTGQF